jgi:hypothetical protein
MENFAFWVAVFGDVGGPRRSTFRFRLGGVGYRGKFGRRLICRLSHLRLKFCLLPF